ncbi:MAG: DNA gyrase inhibitor YacG [Gammaproteobacteria bacterium]|nr:DNA gyrase inhibitor YacG [Gammaproteobacteria bacterium]
MACPSCGKDAIWSLQQNPWRPFCSERCKMIDLGAWADESYRIPDTTQRRPEDGSE